MDFKIDIAGSANEGYKIQGVHAALKQDGKNETRHCHFNLEQSVAFNIQQAYNLLKGRAVQAEFWTPDGKKENVWRQLDLNDRDPAGNYRIKDFSAAYGYNLENQLLQLPLIYNNPLLLKEDILMALKNGDLVEVKLKYEGKRQQFFLESDPKQKSLGVYNAEMKKINLSSFDSKQTKVKAPETRLTKIKKLEIIPPKQIRLSRSRGIS